MSFKAVAWTLLATMSLALVLLFNYGASYQPLSTVAYAGIVLALFAFVAGRPGVHLWELGESHLITRVS